MLYAAATFLVIGLIAAVCGAGRVEAVATKIAIVLAIIAAALFVLSLVGGPSVHVLTF